MASTASAADGTFTLNTDTPADFKLETSRSGYVKRTGIVLGSYSFPTTVDDIEVRLVAAGILSVRVVGADTGLPLDRLRNVVRERRGGTTRWTSCGPTRPAPDAWTRAGTSVKRTLYLGNVEVVQQAGATTLKRYVAGVLVQEIVGAAVTSKYLFTDHLGSVVRATNANGIVLEGMDYGAFGERRGYVDPRIALVAAPHATNRGFTGHETREGVRFIHRGRMGSGPGAAGQRRAF